MDNLTISVASGKGGTGKTTIATNLAVALAEQGRNVAYIDCDVEEPNGHIFLKPEIKKVSEVNVLIPHVDLKKCTFCGECSEICEYNAIAVFQKKVMVFPSLCHSCGGCYHICPERAIHEIGRPIGIINIGTGQGVKFFEGRLNVGEAISPPITRVLRGITPTWEVSLIDAPPGTSCPVIEAVKATDFVVLVSEPTPFGLNDLKLAVEMVRALKLKFGVVINRCDIGDDNLEKYCRIENIDILARLPFARKIAKTYSRGEMISLSDPGYNSTMLNIFKIIEDKVNGNGTGGIKR